MTESLARCMGLGWGVVALVAALGGCDCGGVPSMDECSTESDCDDGFTCVDGMCVERAQLDARVASVDGNYDAGSLDGRVIMFDAGPMCGDGFCGPGEHCEMEAGGTPECIPYTCEELACTETERCEAAPIGTGFVCVDNTCDDSLDCILDEYCNGEICVPDVCTPGVGSCGASDAVNVCTPDGGGDEERFSCGSASYFSTACTTDTSDAFCTCQDDWDCPEFTACERGRCAGSGREPTCFLPPADFEDVLPSMEDGFPWGGTFSSRNATGSPFPASSQVVMTPIVINLDDDNDDGFINESDVPEIVFLTFCGSEYRRDGVLRAVHGGGPNKGADYFANCNGVEWHEGDDPSSVTCACTAADLDSTAGLAAGDLDGDGVPEIVAVEETERIHIYDNTGHLLVESTVDIGGGNPSPTIANIDGEGYAEIIVGRDVLTIDRPDADTWEFVDHFEGSNSDGDNGQGPISCVADLDGDGRQEVIAGGTAYRYPEPPAGATRRSDCSGSETGDEAEWCDGDLITVWSSGNDGFCAVADVLGVDPTIAPSLTNPLDGSPEVVLISNGHLRIYTADGMERRNVDYDAGNNGGAPNIDDFDGDGFPEIGTAFSTRYVLYDLQDSSDDCPPWNNVLEDGVDGLQGNTAREPPAGSCDSHAACGDTSQFACNTDLNRCVCLHNGWRRETEDGSSRVTGSSVFDFNGDGAAEVIYNDECFFRVYSGLNGDVLFREPSESRTRTENPVVADVDNDGNAEIVFAASNESGFCHDSELDDYEFNNGLEVWGDASDSWVSARRIWNQHAYHVTNVLEGGGILPRPPENWREYNGRFYNSYRSQPRSPFGIAPDLVVDRIQISSPDAVCGTLSNTIDITVRVVNQGDLRVGAGVVLAFEGTWLDESTIATLNGDESSTPLTVSLTGTLEAGSEVLLTARYEARFNDVGRLPDSVRAIIDQTDVQSECREDNNDRTTAVDPGEALADLSVEIGTVGGECPTQTVETTVRNSGGTSVDGVVVHYYAGDPAAGGELIGEHTFSGTLASGGEVTETGTINPFPQRSVVIYAVVDPLDAVAECNDGNNTDNTDDRYDCILIF